MATRLVVDTSNILFRVAAMNSKKSFGSDEERAGLALHVSFLSIFKYYKRFNPDHLVFAFEGRNNWRKAHTTSDDSVSGVKYKGNRVKDKSMEPFFELMLAFRDVMEAHSAAVCIGDDNCEADDVIAAYVEKHTANGDEVIVASGDKDFMQLYRYPNFRLIDPSTGKDRKDEYEKKHGEPFDVDWFMFEKCIRGDGGDNVPSAYPRVRKTKMKAAFEDDFKRLELMNEEWTDQNDNTFRVGDLFEENKLLMDLTKQPEWVREGLFKTIEEEEQNAGKYSHFHFLKFLGHYGLNNIAENIHMYVEMLSCTKCAQPQPSPNSGLAFVKKKKFDDDDANVEIEDRTKGKSSAADSLLTF